MPRADHAGRLIRHRDGESAHAAGYVGHGRRDRRLDVGLLGEPHQCRALDIIAQRRRCERFVDGGGVSGEAELGRGLAADGESQLAVIRSGRAVTAVAGDAAAWRDQ